MAPDRWPRSTSESLSRKRRASISTSEPTASVSWPECIDLTKNSDENTRKHTNDEAQPGQQDARKRLKSSPDSTAAPNSDTTTVSTGEYVLLKKDLARVQAKCTEKHLKLEEKERQIDSERQQHSIMEQQLKERISHFEETSAAMAHRFQRVNDDLKSTIEGLRDQEAAFSAVETALQNVIEAFENNKKECRDLKKESRDLRKGMHDLKAAVQVKDNELSDIKSQLIQEQKTNNAIDLVNDRQGARMEKLKSDITELKKKHKAEVSTAKKDFGKAQKDMISMRKERDDLEKQIHHLNEECEQKQEKWDKTKGKLLQQLQDSQGLSLKYNFKVSDSTVIEIWGTIKHKIGQWVDKNTSTVADVADCNMETRTRLQACSPNAFTFLASRDLSPLVFEALLWSWLDDLVFAPASTVWAGSLGRNLNQLVSQVQGTTRGGNDFTAEFYAWRSSSSNFISRLCEPTFSAEIYCEDVISMVKSIAQICGDCGEEDATTDLMEIVADARELDTMLRKSKSEFTFTCGLPDPAGRKTNHGDFNPDMMMRRSNFNKTTAQVVPSVDLVVSPALFKRGNSNGAEYHLKSCIVKMEVVCDAARFLSDLYHAENEQTPAEVEVGTATTCPTGLPGHPEAITQAQSFLEPTTENASPKIKQEVMEQNVDQLDTHALQEGDSSSALPVRPTRRSARTIAGLMRPAGMLREDCGPDELSETRFDDEDAADDSEFPKSKKLKNNDDEDDDYEVKDDSSGED